MHENLLEEQDSHFSVRIDEEAALRCVEATERGVAERTGGGESPMQQAIIAEIEGYQIGVTSSCNRLFLKPPGAKSRRYWVKRKSGRGGTAVGAPVFKAASGHCVVLDRKAGLPEEGLPSAVVEKLDAILERQAFVKAIRQQEQFSEPPADLLEDEESGGEAVDELLGFVGLIQNP